jgi:cation:H+ antiporter
VRHGPFVRRTGRTQGGREQTGSCQESINDGLSGSSTGYSGAVPTALLLLLSGAAVVTVGAIAAMRGIGGFARDRDVPPHAIGAVLFGVNLASLGAILLGAGRNATEVAAGASVGTFVFMIGIAFGVALLASKEPVPAPPVLATLIPLGALVVGAIAIEDLAISRFEGAVLLAATVAHALYLLQGPSERALPEAVGRDLLRPGSGRWLRVPPWLLALIGLGIVYAGANLLIDGSTRLLARTALAPGFVGAVIVGSLASAHRVVDEVQPVRRGEHAVALGNLFGSVVVFSTGAVGLASLIRPLILDSSVAVAYIAGSVLYTVLATVLLARGRAGRVTGTVLILLYGAWIFIARHF